MCLRRRGEVFYFCIISSENLDTVNTVYDSRIFSRQNCVFVSRPFSFLVNRELLERASYHVQTLVDERIERREENSF